MVIFPYSLIINDFFVLINGFSVNPKVKRCTGVYMLQTVLNKLSRIAGDNRVLARRERREKVRIVRNADSDNPASILVKLRLFRQMHFF